MIVTQIVQIKGGVNSVPGAGVLSGKNSTNTNRVTTVIVNCLNGSPSGVACGHGCGQDQHVLIPDHGYGIIAEDQLTARGVLRGDHINGLMGIHVEIMPLGQFLGETSADDLGAVQTKNGIYNGAGAIIRDQLLSDGRGLGKAGFGHANVNIVVDVAVTGGKMPFGDAQHQAVALGFDFIALIGRHKKSPFFFILSWTYLLCQDFFVTPKKHLTRERKCVILQLS